MFGHRVRRSISHTHTPAADIFMLDISTGGIVPVPKNEVGVGNISPRASEDDPFGADTLFRCRAIQLV